MTAQHISTQTNIAAARAAARVAELDAAIDRFVAIGVSHAETGLSHVQAPNATVQTAIGCAKSYEGVFRGVRQGIMLACKMAEPAQAPRPAGQRTATRARVIRGVEDAIERTASDCGEAESLRAELLDRLDAPDFECDIETRPIQEIIEEVARDLGLGETVGGVAQWRRRTPEMVIALSAAAAEPSGQRSPVAPTRVGQPQLRVVDPDWDLPDPDKPLSQWSDAELERAYQRNPDG